MKLSFDLRLMRKALRILRPFATRRLGEPSGLLLHAAKNGLHLAIQNDGVNARLHIEAAVETPGDHVVDFEELQEDLTAIWKNLREGGSLTEKRRQVRADRAKADGPLRLTSVLDDATFRDVSAKVSTPPVWERIQRRTSTPCEGACERPAVAPHLVAAAKSAATALAAPLRFEVAQAEGYIIRVERPGHPSLIAWVQGAKPEEPKLKATVTKAAPKAKSAKPEDEKAQPSKAKATPKAKAKESKKQTGEAAKPKATKRASKGTSKPKAQPDCPPPCPDPKPKPTKQASKATKQASKATSKGKTKAPDAMPAQTDTSASDEALLMQLLQQQMKQMSDEMKKASN